MQFSINISFSLGNYKRQSDSYYRTRIGNRTQAFEWYHIFSDLVCSNPDFKVTPLFNAEYLRNGTRYRQLLTHALLKGVVSNDLEWFSEMFNDTNIARSLCDSWASCLFVLRGGLTARNVYSVRMSYMHVGCWTGLQDLTNCNLYSRSYPLRACSEIRSSSADTAISRQGHVGRAIVDGHRSVDG